MISLLEILEAEPESNTLIQENSALPIKVVAVEELNLTINYDYMSK